MWVELVILALISNATGLEPRKNYMTNDIGLSPSLQQQSEHILQFFEYAHLPKNLQEISRPFGELARTMMMILPRNPERTVALRKLLESKDAAVRAFIAK